MSFCFLLLFSSSPGTELDWTGLAETVVRKEGIDANTGEQTVAPATGTPETGGWSTRELRTILRGLEGINIIAADIVEVAVRSFPFLPASCVGRELTLV